MIIKWSLYLPRKFVLTCKKMSKHINSTFWCEKGHLLLQEHGISLLFLGHSLITFYCNWINEDTKISTLFHFIVKFKALVHSSVNWGFCDKDISITYSINNKLPFLNCWSFLHHKNEKQIFFVVLLQEPLSKAMHLFLLVFHLLFCCTIVKENSCD